jgi:hypothetical protein
LQAYRLAVRLCGCLAVSVELAGWLVFFFAFCFFFSLAMHCFRRATKPNYPATCHAAPPEGDAVWHVAAVGFMTHPREVEAVTPETPPPSPGLWPNQCLRPFGRWCWLELWLGRWVCGPGPLSLGRNTALWTQAQRLGQGGVASAAPRAIFVCRVVSGRVSLQTRRDPV